MATTALFVEILVIGAIAELWIVAVLLACIQPAQVQRLMALATSLKDVSSLVLIFLLAVTYAVGWVVNFASERLFKIRFQQRIRDPLFEGSGIPYERARMLVLQKGSTEFLHEVQLDRHVIRLARSNALSFGLLALALLLHYREIASLVLIVLFVLLSLLSVGSFYQWRLRYDFQYQRVATAATELGITPIRSEAVPHESGKAPDRTEVRTA
jgi:hypothetical protein